MQHYLKTVWVKKLSIIYYLSQHVVSHVKSQSIELGIIYYLTQHVVIQV